MNAHPERELSFEHAGWRYWVEPYDGGEADFTREPLDGDRPAARREALTFEEYFRAWHEAAPDDWPYDEARHHVTAVLSQALEAAADRAAEEDNERWFENWVDRRVDEMLGK